MTDRAKISASPDPEDGRRRSDAAISRRRFIQGAVVASAAAGAAALPAKARGGIASTPTDVAGSASGGREDARGYRILTPAQGVVLVAALNRIIPANEVMPGAGDAGVDRFIDGVLVDAPHLRPRVVALLDETDGSGGLKDARERFVGLTEAEQDARLREMARHRKDAFDALLRAAYTGYYSEPRVLAALGRGSNTDPASPMQPFDTSRLDAVRKRGPLYREVSAARWTEPGGRS